MSNFSGMASTDPELIVEDALTKMLEWEEQELTQLDIQIERSEAQIAALRLQRLDTQVRVQVITAELEAHKAHR